MAKPEFNWTEVDSSQIKSVGYHEPTETLAVKFGNGGLYSYKGVDMDVFVGIVHAESVGRYFDQHVKKAQYPYFKWPSEEELYENLT